jgi:hypothetical protein
MSEVVFEVSEVTGLQCHGLDESKGEVIMTEHERLTCKGEHVRIVSLPL